MKRNDLITIVIGAILIAGWAHDFNSNPTFAVGYSIRTTTGETASPAEIAYYNNFSEVYEFSGKSNLTLVLPKTVRSKLEAFYKEDYPNETAACLSAKKQADIIFVKDARKARVVGTPFNTTWQDKCMTNYPIRIQVHSHPAGYCLPSEIDLKASYQLNGVWGLICRNDGLGFNPDGTPYLNDTYQRIMFWTWD